MHICDLCGEQGPTMNDAKRFTALQMKIAAEEVPSIWTEKIMASMTDWLICPSCALEVETALEAEKGDRASLEKLVEDVGKKLDAMQETLQARRELFEAQAKLADAMLAVLGAKGNKPRAVYRAACKSLLAQATAAEDAAKILQQINSKFGINEDEESISKVIAYAQKCRGEVGFWARLGF